jgi:hydroxymethylglutaryl-CoA lyase
MTKVADVYICESGPRDGLQNLAVQIPTAAKCALIDAIAASGVPEIDAGSFVPAKVVPQFADVDEVISHALKNKTAKIGAFCPNAKGAERALAAGVHIIYFVISASESHNRANVRRTVAEQLDEFRAVRTLIQNSKVKPQLVAAVATAFGCSIEGPISETSVRSLARAFAEGGADEIALADTVGYGNPALVKSLVAAVQADIGSALPLRLHLHDTLGLGLANAYAGLEAGIRRFDAAVSGLGGCPFAPGARGNIVTEDLVFMCEQLGLSTGIDLDKLMATRAILKEHVPEKLLSSHLHEVGFPKALRCKPARSAA